MNVYNKLSDICVEFISKNVVKSDEELEEIDYGIQVILINMFKLTILFLSAYFLGILMNTIVAVTSFAIIRIFASGVHASSNLKCTITNIILFIGNAYLSTQIILNKYILIIIFILSLILIIIYAPADTEDRPLISFVLRRKLKIYSVISTLLIGIIILKYNTYVFANIITFSLLEESLLITPTAYYIFNTKYNNWIGYNK